MEKRAGYLIATKQRASSVRCCCVRLIPIVQMTIQRFDPLSMAIELENGWQSDRKLPLSYRFGLSLHVLQLQNNIIYFLYNEVALASGVPLCFPFNTFAIGSQKSIETHLQIIKHEQSWISSGQRSCERRCWHSSCPW